MRRQRILRASSAQSLCIFCQCRLIGDVPAALVPVAIGTPRRRYNTTQRPRQTANAAAAAPAEAFNQTSTQPTWAFDPNSSLSASEQRERALLQQRREEQQRRARKLEEQQRKRQQEAADAFARQREEESKADQAQRGAVQRQWQLEQGTSKKKANKDRKLGIRRLQPIEGSSVNERAGHGREASDDSHRIFREKKRASQATPQPDRRDAQSTGRQQSQPSSGVSIKDFQTQAQRSGELIANPFVRVQPARVPVPEKVLPPVFGGGANKATAPERSSRGGDGWGSGKVQRAPLLSEGDEIPPEFVPKPPEPSDNPFDMPGGAPQTTRAESGAKRNPTRYLLRASQEDVAKDSPLFDQHPFGKTQASWQPKAQVVDAQQESTPPIFDNSHGAYQAAKRSRHERQDHFQDSLAGGDGEYHATMLDPQQLQQNQTQYDDSHTADWQHLRHKDEKPVQPAASQQQPSGQPQQEWDDAAAIDRIFNEHRAQRPRPNQQQEQVDYTQLTPKQSESKLKDTRPEKRRCGRCGQMGHAARECNGPVRCNVCGQTGHASRTCPQKTGQRHFQPTPKQAPDNLNNAASQAAQPASVQQSAAWGVRSIRGAGSRDTMGVSKPLNDNNAPRNRVLDDGVHLEKNAIADLQNQVASASAPAPDEAEVKEDGNVDGKENEDDEQPAERFLPSRRFRDVEEEPRRDKAPRRSRRTEEDDDEDGSAATRDERNARKAARKVEKARKEAAKEAEKKAVKARKAEQGTPVKLPEFISVATLAQALNVRYESFVSRLERLGYDDVFPGKVLNSETSGMIAMEYNFEPVFESAADEAEERDLKARPAVEDKEFLPSRPPVVTIMGHVDHGKTTILDYLRKSSVAAGEAGGITQHIGAFSVPLTSSGKTITFLDTPGHAAFLAMRQRGANVTDIVILVVAADDSVKPQTLEAIRHAKAAGVPMIVAVNKIDKEGADVQRVKQDLARHGVEIEDFGGDTQVVCVSGKTGAGMDELEEAAVTLSEILDHRAETDGLVEGWVLEATTKKAGRVATVLVRRGTLRAGSIIVAGKTWARVRSLRNEAGVAVQEIGPGMPVEVDGWRDQPAAGDEVLQTMTEQKASDVVDFRREKEEREKTATDMEAINEARRIEQEKREKEKLAARVKQSGAEDYFEAAAAEEDHESDIDHHPAPTGKMEVPFIIKADVSGSAEAVAAYILSISSPLIAPRILRSTVGTLNESDVELAATAEGHIIAFNLPADDGMKGQAEARGVKVLENNIIYRVLDDVKAVLEDKLPRIVTQKVVGEAEISAAFEISVGGRKKMKIAGCKIRNGVINRGSRVRILRGEQKVFDGNIDSLKNVKKDVTEMRKGTECGMGLGDWEAFEVGDQVQTYEETSEKRKL